MAGTKRSRSNCFNSTKARPAYRKAYRRNSKKDTYKFSRASS